MAQRQSRLPGRRQQPKLHLLGKHGFAAAIDGAIASAQQLQAPGPSPAAEVAAAPPALIQGQRLEAASGMLSQRQAGGPHLHRTAGRIDPQLGVGQGRAAAALPRQKALRRQRRDHGAGLAAAVAGGEGQLQPPAAFGQILRQGGAAHPDDPAAPQPVLPNAVLQQPPQLGGHQRQQRRLIGRQWASSRQGNGIPQQSRGQPAQPPPQPARPQPGHQTAHVVEGQGIEPQAGRRIQSLLQQPLPQPIGGSLQARHPQLHPAAPSGTAAAADHYRRPRRSLGSEGPRQGRRLAWRRQGDHGAIAQGLLQQRRCNCRVGGHGLRQQRKGAHRTTGPGYVS